MSKYLEWVNSQPEEFRKEICGNHEPSNKFKDYNFRSIYLDELEKLDKQYILCEAVPSN